jgi:hypothetical protein
LRKPATAPASATDASTADVKEVGRAHLTTDVLVAGEDDFWCRRKGGRHAWLLECSAPCCVVQRGEGHSTFQHSGDEMLHRIAPKGHTSAAPPATRYTACETLFFKVVSFLKPFVSLYTLPASGTAAVSSCRAAPQGGLQGGVSPEDTPSG